MGRRPPRTSLRTSLDPTTLFRSKQSLQTVYQSHLWLTGPSCDWQFWKGLLRGRIPGDQASHAGSRDMRDRREGTEACQPREPLCVASPPSQAGQDQCPPGSLD